MEVITNAPIYVEGNESFLNVGGKDKKKKDKKTGENLKKGFQNIKESDLGKFFIASGGQYLVDKYGNSTYAGGGGDNEGGGSGAPTSQLPPVGDEETKSKMSTGAKVAIGVTAAVVVGVIIYFVTKKK